MSSSTNITYWRVCATPLAVASGSSWDISAWFTTPAYGNEQLANSSDLQLMDPNNFVIPTSCLRSALPRRGGLLLELPERSVLRKCQLPGRVGNWRLDKRLGQLRLREYQLHGRISEINSIRSISAHPNPAHGPLYSFARAGCRTFGIRHRSGRSRVFPQPERYSAGQHRIELNVEALARGICTLVMRNESAITTLRRGQLIRT